MKILLLVNKLTDGGAERVASLWAKGFYEVGYDVSILVLYPYLPVTYHVPSSVKIIPMSYEESRFRYLRYFQKIKLMRNIIREENPDVIISITALLSRSAYLSSIGLKVPIIHTAHNAFERPDGVKMSLGTKLEKFFYNRFYDKVTVLNEADRRVIGKRLSNVTVLPNPLTFEPIKQMPAKEKIVLASGRLDHWHYKGFDILLRAWKNIEDYRGDWKLVIAGSSLKGTGENYLKDLSQKLNIDKSVCFAGYQSDMLPLYRNAAIFALSSRYEGFGMVLLEAMSQGCACIATDYNGRQAEILKDGEEGLLCEPDNIESLCNGLVKLISEESLRIQLGKAAIIRSNYFNTENTTKRWQTIFKEMNILK